MKRLILVTGASRGIGEAIVMELNRIYNADSYFLLLARDSAKLEKVKQKIIDTSEKMNQASVIAVDFSVINKIDDYYKFLKDNLPEDLETKKFDELICVYNHGTLEFGNVALVAQESLRRKFEINLFSVWSVLAATSLLLPDTLIPKQFHINISSGYAQAATANWSAMCCARTSRDTLFNCFALEHTDHRVLNYEPGIVKTDMLKEATENAPDFKDFNIQNCLKPEQTARKLVSIIQENTFINGARIKYDD